MVRTKRKYSMSNEKVAAPVQHAEEDPVLVAFWQNAAKVAKGVVASIFFVFIEGYSLSDIHIGRNVPKNGLFYGHFDLCWHPSNDAKNAPNSEEQTEPKVVKVLKDD